VQINKEILFFNRKMDRKLPPAEIEEDAWTPRGEKRHRRDRDEEKRGSLDLRRSCTKEGEPNHYLEGPCAKIARFPKNTAVDLSTSWPVSLNITAKGSSIKDANSTSPPIRDPGLPIAPSLKEYMHQMDQKNFLPRPEWVKPAARKRLRSSSKNKSSEPSGISHRDLNLEQQTSALQEDELVHETIREGTNHANNGLLPDNAFAAYSSPNHQQHQQPEGGENEMNETHHSGLPGNDSAIASSATLHTDNTANGSGETLPLKTTDSVRITSKPAKPCMFGKDFDTALHVTIREGSTEAALDLIEKGTSVHSENGKGVTPIIIASQKGNISVVKALLDRGASPLAASTTGCTSLLQAAHFGHCDVVRLLLKHGARIELANYKNTTPLMRAAQEGHAEIVDLLVLSGAMVNRRNNEQMSALMLASQRGHANIVQRLVDAGAEVDAMTSQDSTSLMLACKRGHLDVVKALVTSGCELAFRDSRGRTAREMAQRKNMKELLELLEPTKQIDLLRRKARTERNFVMIKMWDLLQKERATVPVDQGDVTIHHISDNLNSNLLVHMRKSDNVLVQAMTLPSPLLENIASFLPLPFMWDERIGMITKRCRIDADSSVSCAFDLIDEVLEEGGFVEACDIAKVTPPSNFNSWQEWKAWGKKFDGPNGVLVNVGVDQQNPSIRNTSIGILVDSSQSPTRGIVLSQHGANGEQASPDGATENHVRPRASSVEMRRSVCFLQLLAYRTPLLTKTLSAPPYNLPSSVIQQLKNVNDIQSLVRRMGAKGVHFNASVAIEMVFLASTLCAWYGRERDDLQTFYQQSQH